MKLNKGILYILLFTFLGGCVKPYDPNFSADEISLYVIEGTVTSNAGLQFVTVSKTSSIKEAQFTPVNNCVVEIIDDQGNVFSSIIHSEGQYQILMNDDDLNPGTSYMLKVSTPEGDVLESAFDQMPTGPEMGDVYFEITDIPQNDPNNTTHGIQIYTDLDASEEDSKYYRYRCTETWEYHNVDPLEWYYDYGGLHQIVPPDVSQLKCWRTAITNDILTLSTVNLSSNSLQKFPLNYVATTTNKLLVMYSLLVEQIALSEDAYNYWDKVRNNLSQDGGL